MGRSVYIRPSPSSIKMDATWSVSLCKECGFDVLKQVADHIRFAGYESGNCFICNKFCEVDNPFSEGMGASRLVKNVVFMSPNDKGLVRLRFNCEYDQESIASILSSRRESKINDLFNL